MSIAVAEETACTVPEEQATAPPLEPLACWETLLHSSFKWPDYASQLCRAIADAASETGVCPIALTALLGALTGCRHWNVLTDKYGGETLLPGQCDYHRVRKDGKPERLGSPGPAKEYMQLVGAARLPYTLQGKLTYDKSTPFAQRKCKLYELADNVLACAVLLKRFGWTDEVTLPNSRSLDFLAQEVRARLVAKAHEERRAQRASALMQYLELAVPQLGSGQRAEGAGHILKTMQEIEQVQPA